jgi:hypothetical protein
VIGLLSRVRRFESFWGRQLDDVHVVIRSDFDYQDWTLRQFPLTFSVPARFVKHMMVVADLAQGTLVPLRMRWKRPGNCSGVPIDRAV